MTIELFTTVGAANEGIKLPLNLPDGSSSGHWLRVRGRDSGVFRRAEHEAARKIRAMSQQGSDFDQLESARIDLLASLVIGWSFDDDFNDENVRRLLVDAPAVAESIDSIAGDRALFFKIASDASETTPPGTTASKRRRKAASKASEKA